MIDETIAVCRNQPCTSFFSPALWGMLPHRNTPGRGKPSVLQPKNVPYAFERRVEVQGGGFYQRVLWCGRRPEWPPCSGNPPMTCPWACGCLVRAHSGVVCHSSPLFFSPLTEEVVPILKGAPGPAPWPPARQKKKRAGGCTLCILNFCT